MSWNQAALVRALTELIGGGGLSAEPDSLTAAYEPLMKLRMAVNPPRLVLRPETPEKLSLAMGYLQRRGIKSVFTGRRPVAPCRLGRDRYVAFDISHMAGVSAIDPLSSLAVMGASTPMSAVRTQLSGQGWLLPFAPACGGDPTLADCLDGDFWGHDAAPEPTLASLVLSGTAVFPDGTIYRGLPVPRSAAGSDLVRTLAGSAGMLAVWCALTVAVIRQPHRRVVRAFQLPDAETGVTICRIILHQWLSPRRLVLRPSSGGIMLLAWFEGDQDRCELMESKTSAVLIERGLAPLGSRQTAAVIAEALEPPPAASLYFAARADWRKLTTVWAALDSATDASNWIMHISGMSMQGAVIHLNGMVAAAHRARQAAGLARAARRAGAAAIRCPDCDTAGSDLEVRLLQGVKEELDLGGILNPGRLRRTRSEGC
ncbi:FAD-binding oxidoreductase [bacterium]|nr:FAD-binding oxidoreductase [candidate division CSSED10-310 bacterium]